MKATVSPQSMTVAEVTEKQWLQFGLLAEHADYRAHLGSTLYSPLDLLVNLRDLICKVEILIISTFSLVKI